MIIIVDWGSDEPLREALREVRDPRLCIVRTIGEHHWCNAKCHNLELRLASNAGLILRVDNDTLIRKDFFQAHPYDPAGFYAVNWRTVPKEVDDKRNLAGTLLIEPKYAWAANGYNERLIHYGKEDDDLYDRLVALGLRWYEMNLDTLEHIPHDDASRYGNLEILDIDPSLQKNSNAKGDLIALSERIMKEQPWTIYDRMTNWNIVSRLSDNYWTCCDSNKKPQECFSALALRR
jgi:hypothetical protein